jgi:hypothetical protein
MEEAIETEISLYGDPVFSLKYYDPFIEKWIYTDISRYTPDPRLYLKPDRVYPAIVLLAPTHSKILQLKSIVIPSTEFTVLS